MPSAKSIEYGSTLFHGFSKNINKEPEKIPLLKISKEVIANLTSFCFLLIKEIQSKVMIAPKGEKIDGSSLLNKYVSQTLSIPNLN